MCAHKGLDSIPRAFILWAHHHTQRNTHGRNECERQEYNKKDMPRSPQGSQELAVQPKCLVFRVSEWLDSKTHNGHGFCPLPSEQVRMEHGTSHQSANPPPHNPPLVFKYKLRAIRNPRQKNCAFVLAANKRAALIHAMFLPGCQIMATCAQGKRDYGTTDHRTTELVFCGRVVVSSVASGLPCLPSCGQKFQDFSMSISQRFLSSGLRSPSSVRPSPTKSGPSVTPHTVIRHSSFVISIPTTFCHPFSRAS